MRLLPEQEKVPQLLVGHETSDDAGVYQLTDSMALIQTIDYFTPVVDDPYMFGQIAAANALSDVYAMGGKPITVMNMVGYEVKKLGSESLAEILRGAADKVKEAGAVTVGGHSIDDQEPKFGLSVTGIVHPEKFWRNIGATPGDVLVLTKPLGIGLLTTGIKRNAVTLEQAKAATDSMALLNKKAALVLEQFSPTAVTDVTGFGLLGHGSEMARGSDESLVFSYNQIPILDGALDLVTKKFVLRGSAHMKALKQAGQDSWIVGEVVNKQEKLITVKR